ncbi:HAUS augmin-like complex subunit 1 [Arapaima gigas]
MSEKITKVMQWLRTVFEDQPVPEFEVNTRTVDLLHQLAESSEARCGEVALLTEDHRQKAAEYQADGCHIQEVLLQGVGLSSGSLSKPASDYLTSLTACAMALKVRDTSLTSFVAAINDVSTGLLEAEKKDREMERELTNVRRNLGATLMLRKTLQDDLKKILKIQEVEKAKAEERLLNMDFIKAKSRDLSYSIKMAEEQLASRKMEPHLTHQAILDISEEIAKLKQEILPITKKLQSYKDLTPSPSLAQVKIEEAKRELAAIDAELEMKVDIMNIMPKQHGVPLK